MIMDGLRWCSGLVPCTREIPRHQHSFRHSCSLQKIFEQPKKHFFGSLLALSGRMMQSRPVWFTVEYFSSVHTSLLQMLKHQHDDTAVYLLQKFHALEGNQNKIYSLFCADANVKSLAQKLHRTPKELFQGFLYRYHLKQKSQLCLCHD